MLNLKAISSLEKVFLGDKMDQFAQLEKITAAAGERIGFQVVIETLQALEKHRYAPIEIKIESVFSATTVVDEVGYIPSELPAYLERCDDDYITKTSGVFPDVLYPVKNGVTKTRVYDLLPLFISIDVPKDTKAGQYEFILSVRDQRDDSEKEINLNIEVKDVTMEQSDLIFTQWLHCDSIADYFGVEMMSEKHWVLLENFIKTAARTGINMMLTPIFTPPLDTAVGTERPTMQLVQVCFDGAHYGFDFSLFDRWVELCHKYGIKYFEMSHLYTQWGVECCPKILVNGERKFGWHTLANGVEYKAFLSEFIPAFTKHLNDLGIAENSYFHISDEPSLQRENDFENYKSAKEFLSPLLKDFKMMDALSNIEFYDKGLVEIPVCATNHIEPFMERDIKERWCYYCCSQGAEVGNRFFAMPSYRNRILGVQLYVMGMVGFLQWGYNFYYAAKAAKKIDPYITSDGDRMWPSGDPYSVYPYEDGAIESIRTKVFYDALQDRMLLKALEKKKGREYVLKLIESVAGMKIDFKNYPRNNEFLLKLHDTVLGELEN